MKIGTQVITERFDDDRAKYALTVANAPVAIASGLSSAGAVLPRSFGV
jgi:hypothetical protein